MRTLSLALFAAAAFACGPSLEDAPTQEAAPSSPTGPDGGSAGVDSGTQVECTPTSGVEPSYGVVPINVAANTPYDDGTNVWQVTHELADGLELELRLHPGLDRLSDPLAAGTYEIAPGTTLENCDVCIRLRYQGPSGVQLFAAESGTLVIDDVDIDRFPNIDIISGHLVESIFRAVEIQAIGPSCTSDAQCGHLQCGDNGQCKVETAATSCATSIGQLNFMTP